MYCGWHGGKSSHYIWSCFPFQKLHSLYPVSPPFPGCVQPPAQWNVSCSFPFSCLVAEEKTLPLWFGPFKVFLSVYYFFSSLRLLNLHSLLNSNSSVVCETALVTASVQKGNWGPDSSLGQWEDYGLPWQLAACESLERHTTFQSRVLAGHVRKR